MYYKKNYKKLKEYAREAFKEYKFKFFFNNEADKYKSVSIINQIQYAEIDNDIIGEANKSYRDLLKTNPNDVDDFITFLSDKTELFSYQKRIYDLSIEIYDHLDNLMPVAILDTVKDKEDIFSGAYTISTASFDDVKQLYVDLYELIVDLIFIPIGLDNIINRGSYNIINTNQFNDINCLDDAYSKMKNKGNILKLIDYNESFGKVIKCNLDADIRNSIGHYHYKLYSQESLQTQLIIFEKNRDDENSEVMTLLEFCYDIWQMYKTLGVYNSLIYMMKERKYIKDGLAVHYR